MTAGRVVEAAGGVVLRDDGREVEVLVIHRVRYDDWSLPKGKLDPGEDAETAAVREVAEETGVVAEIGEELRTIEYQVLDGVKRVRWFRMWPIAGDPTARLPDREVDVARWIRVSDADGLLTYGRDLGVLAEALEVLAGNPRRQHDRDDPPDSPTDPDTMPEEAR